MAVSNLHEAALVLQGAYQGIVRLLDETEPMERAVHRACLASDRADDTFERIWEESGYGAFSFQVDALRGLLAVVERRENEEGDRAA